MPPGQPAKNNQLPLIFGIVLVTAVALGGIWFIASGDDDDSSGGSGGSASSEEQAYIDALIGAAEDDPELFDDDSFGPEAVPCLAEASVQLVGVDRLAEIGTPDEIRSNPDLLDESDAALDEDYTPTREEAEAMHSTIGGCVDWVELQIEGAPPGIPQDDWRCVIENLDPDVLEEVQILALMEQEPGPEYESAFEAAGTACGVG